MGKDERLRVAMEDALVAANQSRHELAPLVATCIESQMSIADHMETFAASVGRLSTSVEFMNNTTSTLGSTVNKLALAVMGDAKIGFSGLINQGSETDGRFKRVEERLLATIKTCEADHEACAERLMVEIKTVRADHDKRLVPLEKWVVKGMAWGSAALALWAIFGDTIKKSFL